MVCKRRFFNAFDQITIGCDGGDDAKRFDVAMCGSNTSKSFVRPLEDDTSVYPFKSCAFQTPQGRMHFFDEGPRDAKETIPMIHRNPTWSFLYRNMAKAMIAKGHRVIAVDHLGMGMSDSPEPAVGDYSPISHSANLEELVKTMDLKNLTLVLQDWEGPVGLGMAIRQPQRISRVLVMTTWAWWVDPANSDLNHGLLNWG